ncbi:TIGR03086 family metal-binding protein [Streptomyces monomycini]|uniref:TIGR03086 family metal-binding protein n=1 Tax=Streptomyces monomycini TaxID=371720 RepID=UPI001EE9BB36|nr:TIGR03086 family metal-binding protein [Streptomyces monomycini]
MSGTPAPAADLRPLHRAVLDTATELVGRVRPEHLGLRTPCAAWNLGELVAHMTGQNLGFAAAARGQVTSAADFAPRPAGDAPGAEFADSARRVVAAFAEPGVLQRRFALPELGPDVTVRARRGIGFHFVDTVVHAWDVARSLGTPVTFPAEILTPALEIARTVPGGAAREEPDAAFGPVRETPAAGTGAVPALGRILALLGRSPAWPDGDRPGEA